MNFYKTESDFSKRELPFHGSILNRATTRVLLRIINGNILSIKAHFRLVIINLLVFENHLFRRPRVNSTNAYDMWVYVLVNNISHGCSVLEETSHLMEQICVIVNSRL